MILVVGALAALALAGATLYLIALNWNAQLAPTVLSVALGGTVTLFIAVFSQLKESTVSGQFAVEIPFDSSTGFPISGLSAGPQSGPQLRRSLQLTALYRIALAPHLPTPVPGKSSTLDVATVAKPVSVDEMFSRSGQILQFKLLEDLRDNGVGGSKPLVLDGGEVPSFFRRTPAGPVVDYPPQELGELLHANPYSAGSGLLMWERRTLRVPPKAQISLRHVPSSEATGVTKDLIIVERASYFRAVVSIEPLGAGRDGTSAVHTVRIAVTMKATIYRTAAGSSYSAGAKAWCEWLFGMLQEVNAS